MQLSLLNYIACPNCHSGNRTLHLVNNGLTTKQDDEIVEGMLACLQCDITYPVLDGLPYLIIPNQQADILSRSEGSSVQALDEYVTATTKAVARLLDRVSRGCGVCVDVGCGRSPYAGNFHGSNLICIDLFPSFLKDLRKTKGSMAGMHYVIGDARRLPIADQSVDLIFCSNIIEHLYPDEAVETVQRYCSLAKSDVLIDVPNGAEHSFITRVRKLVYHTTSLTDIEINHTLHPELDHHSTFVPDWFSRLGFETHGCIGYVSRQKIRLGVLWDIFDGVAWYAPSIGGTLMAHYSRSHRPVLDTTKLK